MKTNYEKMGYEQEFNDYNDLYITPMHVHKSKDDHEKAIYVLSSELSMIVAEENATYQTTKLNPRPNEKTKQKKKTAGKTSKMEDEKPSKTEDEKPSKMEDEKPSAEDEKSEEKGT